MIKMATHTESLSHSQIPKIALPNTKLGAIFTLVSAGKCSGEFPFTAGLYPLSVKENPSRMFAEGGPERTNKLSLCKCRIARKTLTA
jgi:methylmalonyl-CoA mutase